MSAKEKHYYPIVQKYLEKRGYTCQSRGKKKKFPLIDVGGIERIRIDVAGVKTSKQHHDYDVEIVAVEVKPYQVASVSRNWLLQAQKNSLIANKCYFAMPKSFEENAVRMAADFGIGLLEIRKKKVRMISESRTFCPNKTAQRTFLYKQGIIQCNICGCYFFKWDENGKREGGSYRQEAISNNWKWIYFCENCRKMFRNWYTTKNFEWLEREIKKLKNKN
ncbi:MAG: hypothetical protein WC634_01930 [archaeon]